MKGITKSRACEEDSCGRCGVIQGSSEVHLAGPRRRFCRRIRRSGWGTEAGTGAWGSRFLMNGGTPVTSPQPQLSPRSGCRGVEGTQRKRRLEKELGLPNLAPEPTKMQIKGRKNLKAQQRGMPALMGSFLRATMPALWQPPQRAKNWVWAARQDRLELSRKEGEGE